MKLNRRAVLLGTVAAPFLARSAWAADTVKYILPASADLPSYGIWRMAQHLGYYREVGLDVEFLIGQGGVNSATQVGAGNGDFSGGIGDTSMIVRANGVPVKGILLMGNGALTVLAVRKDSGITTPKDLKGKSVSVIGFQDTSFYALLGILGSAGLTKADVDIQALGPAGMTQAVVAGSCQAMATIPDLIPPVQEAGVALDLYSSKDFTPSMAQATLTSEKLIKDNPDRVRRFAKATLRSFADFRADPAGMARRFVEATPSQIGKEARVEDVFKLYARFAWGNSSKPGTFDPEVLKKLQEFYVKSGIIRRSTRVDELYTNEFALGT